MICKYVIINKKSSIKQWRINSLRIRSSAHRIFGAHIWILLYVAFCTIMAISRQKEARSRDYALLLFRMTTGFFFIVHSTIGSTVHSRPLNSLEHCYAQPRWQISGPTGIRTWYPHVTSPSRYEWAIEASFRGTTLRMAMITDPDCIAHSDAITSVKVRPTADTLFCRMYQYYEWIYEIDVIYYIDIIFLYLECLVSHFWLDIVLCMSLK